MKNEIKLKKELVDLMVKALKEHSKDSREYLDDFYNQCQNNEIDDLDWIEDDNDFMDFIGRSETEYSRIYDIAILNLSNKLLSILDIETSNNEGSD